MIPVESLPSVIAAAGTLGTACYGLVDSTKVMGGGVSLAGFGYIRDKVAPLVTATGSGPDQKEVLDTLLANWLNGMPKPDQKAAAKALIRLRLDPSNAPTLAGQTGVNPTALMTVATKIANGEDLLSPDLNALGRFDAVVSAKLDAAYERADQCYRNMAKSIATVLGLVLGPLAAWLSGADPWQGLLAGLLAAPVAPVAKDASTVLVQAVSLMRGLKR